MQIKVFKDEKGNRLADVRLDFEEGDALPAGVSLTGFSIVRGKDGDNFVSVPARQYEKDGEKRYFNFLRATNKDATEGLDALKAQILAKYGG